jgi:hypothetical protein
MKVIFIYIIIFVSLFSCGQTKNKSEENFDDILQHEPEEKTEKTISNQIDTTHITKIPDRLKKIVKNIATINEVQCEHIGFAGIESENYKNFLQLKQVATVDELVALTNDINNTVACYASWALADIAYSKLPAIFTRFIQTDKTVGTFCGCLQYVSHISVELYYRYWNNIDYKIRDNDSMLFQLDSIILYNKNSDWLLIHRALENRIYPTSYQNRIKDLAFKHGNHDALFYLCTWHKADNYDNIKKALITYLEETDFSKTGINYYYKTIDELLKFGDAEIETLIIQKLNTDKFWKHEKHKFQSLLNNYSIYENFD